MSMSNSPNLTDPNRHIDLLSPSTAIEVPAAPGAGEVDRSAHIAKKIRAALGSWGLSASTQLTVEVVAGVARFNGVAASNAEREKLITMALEVMGVDSVDVREVTVAGR